MNKFLVLSLLAVAAAGCDEQCDSGDLCPYIGTGEMGVSPDGTPALEAMTYMAVDLAFGPEGRPFVLDWNNHRIFRLDESDLVQNVTGTAGLLGDGPQGPSDVALWNHPTHVTWREDGTMVVAAWHNSRIHEVDTAGNLTFTCGTGGRAFDGDNGPAAAAKFDLPVASEFDEDGNLYIADQANQRVRRVGTDGIVTTIVGMGDHGFSGDGGPANLATLAGSRAQEATPSSKIDYFDGAIYLADTDNGRVRKVDLATGMIETIAGTGIVEVTPGRDPVQPCSSGCGYSGDGGDATDAELLSPVDVAVASDGTVFVADTGNHCVRRIGTDGVISTVAGVCGTAENDGDFGPATEAHLNQPFGIALDSADVLYIADTLNSRIRMVAP